MKKITFIFIFNIYFSYCQNRTHDNVNTIEITELKTIDDLHSSLSFSPSLPVPNFVLNPTSYSSNLGAMLNYNLNNIGELNLQGSRSTYFLPLNNDPYYYPSSSFSRFQYQSSIAISFFKEESYENDNVSLILADGLKTPNVRYYTIYNNLKSIIKYQGLIGYGKSVVYTASSSFYNEIIKNYPSAYFPTEGQNSSGLLINGFNYLELGIQLQKSTFTSFNCQSNDKKKFKAKKSNTYSIYFKLKRGFDFETPRIKYSYYLYGNPMNGSYDPLIASLNTYKTTSVNHELITPLRKNGFAIGLNINSKSTQVISSLVNIQFGTNPGYFDTFSKSLFIEIDLIRFLFKKDFIRRQ